MTDIASLAVRIDATEVDQGAKSLDGLTASGAKAEVAMEKVATGHKSAAAQANMQHIALMELQGSARGAFDAIAAGQSPLRVLAMEGGRVTQAISMSGGLGGALEMLGGLISPVVVGVGAIAAVVGVAAAAFIAGRHESEEFNKALAVTGDYAGITAGQYEAMAHRIADSTGAGLGKARNSMLSVIESGKFTGQTIEYIGGSAVKLAALTGQSSDKFTEQFMKMADGVGDFAVKFNSTYHVLTEAQIEHIRLLEDEGKTEQAKYEASKEIYDGLGKIAPQNLGLLEEAWKKVAGAISYAWDELKGFGRDSVPEEQLRGLDQRIAALKAQNSGGYETHTIELLQKQRDAMAGVVAQHEAAQKAQTAANQAQQAGIDAGERLRTSWSHYGDSVKLANQEIAKYRHDIELLRKVNPNSADLPSAARQAEAEADIRKKYMPDATAATRKSEQRAEALTREAAAAEATIKGNLALAVAYGVSGEAAMRQEAATKATAAALTKTGDVDAFVSRQLMQSVSEQAAAGAKTLYGLSAENDLRKKLNDQVAAGTITVAQANQQLKDEAALRSLVAAAALAGHIAEDEAAKGHTKAAQQAADAQAQLLATIQKTTDAQGEANRLAADAKLLNSIDDQKDHLAFMQKQLDLVGATNMQRAVELAQLQAAQQLKRDNIDPNSDRGKEYVANAEAQAAAGAKLQQAQDSYNASLGYTLDLLQQVDTHARDAFSGMERSVQGLSKGLTDAVKGVGGLITAYTGLAAKEEAIRKQKAADQKNLIKGSTDWMHYEVLAARESQNARVSAYADMADAAKGFFEQNSAGYKAMQVLEIALHTIEMLNAIEAMAVDATHTASSVANSGVRASAHGVEAYAKTMASLPFPFNLAAGATVLAALAAVGVAITGGGGGAGSIPGEHDAADRQAAMGTGSILGDAKAKSDSINHALQIVAANSNKDLEYSNSMLTALRSIDSQIGSVAAAVGKSLGVGGMLDTSGLNLGTSVQGPSGLMKLFSPLAAIMPGLFGTTTTSTLQDLGVQFNPETIGSIIASGINGSTYEQVATEKKKKAFGFTYSDKTRVNTSTGALDPDFVRQTNLLIGSLRDGVVEAASVLGVQGAQATLNAFTLNLGKLSFKDMSADEIQKALENVFSKAADDMAHAVLPMLGQFQKAGEGQFETLARLAREYQVVDVSMKSIGKTFGAVGVNSIAARDRLVEMMGGMDNLQSATSAYADAFLTDAEKLAPIRQAVDAELTRLGLSNVKSKDQFKAVVQGLDVSTEAGAKLYAALMNLAPAFAKVADGVGETQAVIDARSALTDAYGRESDALKGTIDTFTNLAGSLHAYGQSLYSGPAAALSPEQQYLANRADFQRVSGLAATGDKDALGQLQNVSQAYLDASKAYYASSQGYFNDLAAVKDAVTAAEGVAGHQADLATQQLDQMTATVGQLVDLNQNVVTVQQAIANLQAALAPPQPLPTPQAPPTTSTSGGTSATANDNAQIVSLLQTIISLNKAGLTQQGAIAAQDDAAKQAILDKFATLIRRQQA